MPWVCQRLDQISIMEPSDLLPHEKTIKKFFIKGSPFSAVTNGWDPKDHSGILYAQQSFPANHSAAALCVLQKLLLKAV